MRSRADYFYALLTLILSSMLFPMAASAQNVKPEEQSYIVRFADMLSDKAEIIIDDAEMRSIVCPGLVSCKMNLSSLSGAVQKHFNNSMQQTWKTTDCGTRFNASFSGYDCGRDSIPDAMIHFTGYHIFDCNESDNSGIYVLIHRNSDDYILSSSAVSWRRSSVTFRDDSRIETIMDNGEGSVDFDYGIVTPECRIQTTVKAQSTNYSAVIRDDSQFTMSSIEFAAERSGSHFYALTGVVTDAQIETLFIDNWKKYTDFIQRAMFAKFSYASLSGYILSTAELEQMTH